MRTAVIPYAELEAIFLDVGNTLVSMDYEWIRGELAERGRSYSVEAVKRAEAAARPVVSHALAEGVSTEGIDTFTLYLETMLEALAPEQAEPPARLARELALVLRGSGRERLWSYVLPGVPEALSELRSLGLRLAAVSNSDGTVENVLVRCGLRDPLEAVFDSHLVGHEKPDPRLFRHALESTGVRAERTLHVGDLYSADVEGARAAGVHAALVDPYGLWSDVDCVRFADLTALCATLRRHREGSRR